MAKEVLDLRQQLQEYRFKMGINKKIECSKEENLLFKQMSIDGQDLPEGVFRDEPYNTIGYNVYLFYRIGTTDLSENEILEYLMYKQLDILGTIKYRGY
jgi:hypothetical protein